MQQIFWDFSAGSRYPLRKRSSADRCLKKILAERADEGTQRRRDEERHAARRGEAARGSEAEQIQRPRETFVMTTPLHGMADDELKPLLSPALSQDILSQLGRDEGHHGGGVWK